MPIEGRAQRCTLGKRKFEETSTKSVISQNMTKVVMSTIERSEICSIQKNSREAERHLENIGRLILLNYLVLKD